ncbi:MAG: type IV pilus assembly protein PilM, partial [Planctomycetota bacterium]
MAKIDAAWGIDIGNAALKAIRLRPGGMPGQVVADAFDFIEYPMLLSQPGAERETLVETALQQFLSRNDVRGTRVAVAVPGQAGLARFIKLPPVEAKKIPNIVLFEAKQQIPYDLDSVVWRFQRMDADIGESQFAIEPEIGLFALKKDQVMAALEPLQAVGVEVDIIQLTPLALYNFIRFDKLRDLPPPDEYDPDDPPPSTVIVSVGTDSTDLVVTNGFRVWQRNISVGGSSFTKALSKELKLTFSKAEHLKKNINTAPDPKQAFQAMRPVFNELLAQIQHSIGYYTTIDRAAKIEHAIAVGSTFQLPGLRKFIEQGLGVPVELAEDFETLEGPEVTASPVFQEHRLSFGVSYGLALQGIDLAAMKINMLPDEIVRERAIRAKKPWRLAGAATVLTGLALSFALRSMALSQVSPTVFGSAEQAAKAVIERANNYKSQLTTVEGEFDRIDTLGKNVTENVEGRLLWLELLAAINKCLPSDPPGQQPEDLSQRELIFVDSIQSQKVADLGTWWQLAKKWYRPIAAQEAPAPGMPVDPAAADPNAAVPPVSPAGVPSAPTPPPAGIGTTASTADSGTETEIPGPEGEGYLIQITAHHFHNAPEERVRFGAEYVRQTLIKNLETASIQFGNEVVTMKELGISHPCLINPG